jgi:hypothetical protein
VMLASAAITTTRSWRSFALAAVLLIDDLARRSQASSIAPASIEISLSN